MDWYKETIEEPIRDIVRLLRDNGFNTECSCGHEMYVQCQYVRNHDMKRLSDLLYNYMHGNSQEINYKIVLTADD